MTRQTHPKITVPARSQSKASIRNRHFHFAAPRTTDGADIYRLVRDGGTLELNTAYAYLLLGMHFSETSVVVRNPSTLCGFVWAYILPERNDTLFVWQIGVTPASRGAGLASEMLREALRRPACRDVTHLEATVTPSNQASMALFRGLGEKLGANVAIEAGLETTLFPETSHEAEMLIRVGPFDPIT